MFQAFSLFHFVCLELLRMLDYCYQYMSYFSTAPLSWDLAKVSPWTMAWLWERTHYKLDNNNYKIRLNPMLQTSIKILIQCSCVSEDTKWVLPLLRLVAIRCTAILNTFFFNRSPDSLTNIDWLLQSHSSIGCFHWFITPTFSPAFNICPIFLV